MGTLSASRSIEVNASIDEIWKEIIDVKSWPDWKPFVTKAKIAGGYETLSNGSKIKMSLIIVGQAPVPLSVTVCDFNRPTSLAWYGGVKGLVYAVHAFDFKDMGENKTLVTSKEEFNGALVGLLKLFVSEDEIAATHQRWVLAIKNKMEGARKPEKSDGHGCNCGEEH